MLLPLLPPLPPELLLLFEDWEPRETVIVTVEPEATLEPDFGEQEITLPSATVEE